MDKDKSGFLDAKELGAVMKLNKDITIPDD